MGDSDFWPPGAQKPLNRLSWNLAWLIMSSTRLHMTILRHTTMWGWGEVVISHASFILISIHCFLEA